MFKEFTNFCFSNGIIHQTSCPHASQQNSVAERKLRHILDVVCTSMFHVHVPKLYCCDIVLTACYLINRMSSPIIDNRIPISCLFHDAILFHVTRIFCCTSFIHVLWTSLEKLSPRAIKCIFLGYSHTQKAYCCYDSIIRK